MTQAIEKAGKAEEPLHREKRGDCQKEKTPGEGEREREPDGNGG